MSLTREHATEQTSTALPATLPVTVIRPTRGWRALNLREVWEYRELLYFLAWRDVKVHYKQAALGVAWAVMQPLVTMVIFYLIFSRLAHFQTDNGVPYPVFAFAALLPWQLFAGALARSSTSLVSNANLLTKVYFPRLVIPFSAVTSGLVDFAVSFGVFLLLMLYYRVTPTWALLTFPLFILLALLTALAVGLWLSALNVQYRDVQYLVPFLVQVWMFASPVAYSTHLVPSGIWRTIYGLNPMAGVIQGFRWALAGGHPPGPMLAVSIGIVLLLLVGGLAYFARMERNFADVV